MLRNYLIITYRNIRQSPLYAVINILSLAIGLATCMIIYLFISDELRFDKIHSKRDNIYRIYEVPHYNGSNVQKVALTMGWMGPSLASDYPEIISYSRYWSLGKKVFKREDHQLLIDNIAAADSTFLGIFDFELFSGDRSTALNEPNSVILTEETALKIFNDADVTGKTISINDIEYKITGVLKNVPENSHLRFGALESISTYSRKDPTFKSDWDGSFLNTYLLLRPGTDINSLEVKLPDFLRRHNGNKDIGLTMKLQSLADVHLNSSDIEHDYNNYRRFNGLYLRIFIIIGICIMLIASVNFMNLTLARSSYRWKEIGLRKSAGARRIQLFGQFIFESVLLALLALIIAMIINMFLIPALNEVFDRHFVLNTIIEHPIHLIVLVAGTIFLGILSGIYPSFYITSPNVINILKGETVINPKPLYRSFLVILQFSVALAMIECTIVVAKQLSFMKNSDMGFNKEQLILIGMNKEVNTKFEVLRAEWLRTNYVSGVTASSQRIGNNFNGWGFKLRTDTGVYSLVTSNVNVDYDYLKVYGIKLKDGRDFSRDFRNDKGKAFIINETMVSGLNLKNPVGTPAGHSWNSNDSLGAIIGVVHDFNYNSFHNKIGMLALVCHPEWGYEEITIKIDGAHSKEAISSIKDIWDRTITTYPFSFTFLNEHFENLYRSDQQMSSIVTVMAFLAILIACMGLFGLVVITANRRRKEIGIRKINGARIPELLILLNRNLLQWVGVAFIIASPIAWFVLNRWMQNFAYKIAISWVLFVMAGLLTLTIALLTASWQSWRTASGNPVEALRNE